MNIEETVRTSMDQFARDLQPATMPDPAAVRASVHRSRRIRSIAAVGLAAAVAAATVVGVAELRDRSNGSGPTPPVDSVELGDDPNAVWMVDGVLHIGTQAYPQHKTIVTALVPTKNGAVYGARGGEIIYQPAVGGPAQIIRTDGEEQPAGGPAPLGPAADPDSDVVAVLRWSTADGRYDLYLYGAKLGHQLSTGAPLGDDTFTLPGDDNPFGEALVAPIEWTGATDGGGYTALIRNGSELWRYEKDPSGAGGVFAPIGPTPLDATLDVFVNVEAGGQLTFTRLKDFQVGEVPTFETLSSVDGVEADGGLSHDGAYYAALSTDPDHSGAIAVVTTQSGRIGYIDPPTGTEATFPSWSRGHTLMFRATDTANQPSGFVVACDADTLACETVAEVDDINQTVLPRL